MTTPVTPGPLPGPDLPGGITLPRGRTLVMGILNVTPDSFSDGGRWDTPSPAIDHAHEMVDLGADIVDVGGESTRPHSTRLDAEEEWGRIGEVVATLAAEGVVVSVDTVHARTARRAADAGAALVNDVSGGCADAGMLRAVAATTCAFVVQHWRGFPGSAQEHVDYGDVLADVLRETGSQVGAALRAGIAASRLVVDPGLGFSLLPDQCWEIVGSMGRLRGLGYPVLIGASRKRFLATGPGEGLERDAATAEVTRLAVEAGMWAVRVHDVAPSATIVRGGAQGKEGTWEHSSTSSPCGD